MRRLVVVIFINVMVITLSACSGQMKGIDRYSGKRVYLEYEDEKFGSAQIHIAMPDGEKFSGKLIDDPLPSEPDKGFTQIDEFPGNAQAILYGDQGTEMRCKFRLSDKLMGFKSGGYGLCETSKGHVIDIFTR